MAEAATLGMLAAELEAEGQTEDARVLREVQEEIDAVEKPPGVFKRLSAGMKKAALQQWTNVVGELQESKEVWTLVRHRMKTGEDLTVEQKDVVRAQVLDVLRVVPAGLVAAGNAALPVPGTGWFTPLILKSMGLLPSRWREAHALRSLEKEADHLEALGDVHRAEQVREIITRLEADADHRAEVDRSCALLTHWDANDNGIWDPDEVAAYRKCCERIWQRRDKQAQRKFWFFQLNGHVFGPVRLSELRNLDPDGELLVCYDGGGWVSWRDLARTDGQVCVSAGEPGSS
ncbi:MAG TPA: hypothetical protein QGF58_22030 [Myxococcota bacterium]|nr:hypothetical protein [Myxococcota bacterium]